MDLFQTKQAKLPQFGLLIKSLSSRLKSLSSVLFIFCVAIFLGSCSSLPLAVPSDAEVSKIYQALASYPKIDAERETQQFLLMTESMKTYADTYVSKGNGAGQRLIQVFKAIHQPSLGVTYSAGAHFNAQEVFEFGRANCLSYSAFFIAMSRHVKLKARFQEVDLPPSWSQGSKDLLLRFRHVNVIINLGSGREKVADFRLERFSHFYPRREITDQQALSLHYNNLAVEAIFEKDWAQTLSMLAFALAADSERTIVWSNLGLVFKRTGELELADIAYRHALSLDSHDYSVMNNLAQLYRQTGKQELSKLLSERSSKHRNKNPYFHFANAEADYRNKDYPAAIKHIDRALRINKHEANFMRLKAMILWASEQKGKALALMEKAYSLEENKPTKDAIYEMLKDWKSSP